MSVKRVILGKARHSLFLLVGPILQFTSQLFKTLKSRLKMDLEKQFIYCTSLGKRERNYYYELRREFLFAFSLEILQLNGELNLAKNAEKRLGYKRTSHFFYSIFRLSIWPYLGLYYITLLHEIFPLSKY